MALITIVVNKETIENGNAELLLCEARDYIEETQSYSKKLDKAEWKVIWYYGKTLWLKINYS